MKKTIRTIISILAVGAMLLSFAACESKKQDTMKDDTVKEDTVMKAVFEDITSDEAYISWKEMYPAAMIEEKLDGSKLTFTVTYKDGAPADQEEDDITNDAEIAAGEFVFTHDGDYIVGASGSTEKYINPEKIFVPVQVILGDMYVQTDIGIGHRDVGALARLLAELVHDGILHLVRNEFGVSELF